MILDSDMMEAEASVPTQPTEVIASTTGQDDIVRGLLVLARQLIEHGKPSQALQAVMMAMQKRGGNEAVLQTFTRAQELYRTKLHAGSAADQLASLFAECAIAEALPSSSETLEMAKLEHSIQLDANGTSILAETGRKQVVLDAFSDGSSFVCLQCGGLVSNHRKEEHYAHWCCKI